MGRPRLVINEAAALAEWVRLDDHMRARAWYGAPVSLADVARTLAVPVRTFQRWAVRTGFVARARDLTTKSKAVRP